MTKIRAPATAFLDMGAAMVRTTRETSGIAGEIKAALVLTNVACFALAEMYPFDLKVTCFHYTKLTITSPWRLRELMLRQ